MSYYSDLELENLGFKYIGKNVKISKKACIYGHNNIKIGSNSRIDDLCIISGKIEIGRNVHITPQCLLAGGTEGLELQDFTTLAYGVKVFTQSDDYSGRTLTNSTIPKKYKNEFKKRIIIKKYSIIGANSTIMPGIIIEEGTSVGANSLMLKDSLCWSIYAGVPAIKIKGRSKKMLLLIDEYLKNENEF